MTLPAIKESIISSLLSLYGPEESVAIANTLISHVLNPAANQSFDKMTSDKLEAPDRIKIEAAVARLIKNEPLQYVLGEAWFFDMPFYVNKHVLIPRPETEELVDHILKSPDVAKLTTNSSILDIGTGSGCIAIALKSNLPQADVYGVDISEEALAVASFNAQQLNANVTFINADILQPDGLALPPLDIIVSNPPYITEAEKELMHENVLGYEPHLALFVSDGNPLQFYDAIVRFALSNLKKAGRLYVELNANYGEEVKACLERNGFNQVTLIHDMQGKTRFACGSIR